MSSANKIQYDIVYQDWLEHDFNRGCSWSDDSLEFARFIDDIFKENKDFKSKEDKYAFINLNTGPGTLDLKIRELKSYKDNKFKLIEYKIENKIYKGILISKDNSLFYNCLILRLEDFRKLNQDDFILVCEYIQDFLPDGQPFGYRFIEGPGWDLVASKD